MKKAIVSTALILTLSTSAFAAEIPSEVNVQNLNGSQQYIETFTVSQEIDPETLKRDTFEHEGFSYSFATITEQENHFEDTKAYTETVTVETAKKDLSDVLATLSPTIAYNDGEYSGTLTLDHTTIATEAAGYESRSYSVSDSKTYGGLVSNDMALIPVTTVKDGVTLNLSNVDWQTQATALVDGVLVPSQYQAVASYGATSWYSAATGYISTANYVGEISTSGIDSVTYTLTYLGEEIPVVVDSEPTIFERISENPVPVIGVSVGGALLISLAVMLVLAKRENNYLRSVAAHVTPAEEIEEETE